MKYTCDLPELKECFIELSDSWTRKEVRSFWEFEGPAYLALVLSKLTAVHLVRPGQEPITEPVEFSAAVLDELDMRLVRWVSSVPVKHVSELGSLGEACGRRLFASTETNLETESAAPTPLPTPGS
jgi:hypothetical protein